MPVQSAANLVRLQREVDGPTAPAARPDDPTVTLAKLADLRHKGALTPAEYEAKKAELLGRM